MIPEKELKIVEAALAAQAKEDLETWKRTVPVVAQVMMEAEIRQPNFAKAMQTIWEKGYAAGFIRATGMKREVNDEQD